MIEPERSDGPGASPPVVAALDPSPGRAASEAQSGARPDPVPGEGLGPFVHRVRLDFNAGLERPFGLVPWDERHPRQRELDERIGETVAAVVRASVRGAFGHVLREHYLAGIARGGAPERCNPVCACSAPFRLYPSTGRAVEAWIGHVMDVVSTEEESHAAER